MNLWADLDGLKPRFKGAWRGRARNRAERLCKMHKRGEVKLSKITKRTNWKKSQKSWKKVLTKGGGCDIMLKLSRESRSKDKQKAQKAHWKLNNKHHKIIDENRCVWDSEILLKNKKILKKQSKEQKRSLWWSDDNSGKTELTYKH